MNRMTTNEKLHRKWAGLSMEKNFRAHPPSPPPQDPHLIPYIILYPLKNASNKMHLNPLTRNNMRASPVPAAAVIPAPIGYIKVVAVKKLVV